MLAVEIVVGVGLPWWEPFLGVLVAFGAPKLARLIVGRR